MNREMVYFRLGEQRMEMVLFYEAVFVFVDGMYGSVMMSAYHSMI